jgi:hypothetical protein
MNGSACTLAIRREALIEQIAHERDQVAHACRCAQQRIADISNHVTQLRGFAQKPTFIAAVLTCTWMIGWRRSVALVKNIALGWSAWQRITDK